MTIDHFSKRSKQYHHRQLILKVKQKADKFYRDIILGN